MFALSTVGHDARRRRRAQRGPAAGGPRRAASRLPALPRPSPGAGSVPSPPSSGRPLEHVHPDPGGVARRAGGGPAVGAARARSRLRPAPRSAAARSGSRPASSPRRPGPSTAWSRSPRWPCAGSCAATPWSPDLPVALSLRGSSAVWLEPEPGADPAAARALARALVAQYVLWHGPDDALLAVVAPPYLAPEWEWVKWLPHVAHPRRCDAIGPLRTVTADADDVRRWWAAELAGRPAGSGAGEPHLLVVVDDAAGPGPWAAVAGRDGAPRRCPARTAARPVRGAPAGRHGPARAGRPGRHGHRDRAAGRADASPEATALARRLARYRPAGAGRGRRRSARPGRPPRAARPARAGDAGRAVAALREGRTRRRPAAGADRRRRDGRAGRAGPQGVRAGRQRTARALHRGHRLGQERAAAHARARAGGHALVRGAEPRARRLQGRRHVPRPRRPAARRRGDHQPRRTS